MVDARLIVPRSVSLGKANARQHDGSEQRKALMQSMSVTSLRATGVFVDRPELRLQAAKRPFIEFGVKLCRARVGFDHAFLSIEPFIGGVEIGPDAGANAAEQGCAESRRLGLVHNNERGAKSIRFDREKERVARIAADHADLTWAAYPGEGGERLDHAFDLKGKAFEDSAIERRATGGGRQPDKGAASVGVGLRRRRIGEMGKKDDAVAARPNRLGLGDQRFMRRAADKRAKPFDRAARSIEPAANIGKLAMGRDRALKKALRKDGGIFERRRGREQDGFGCAHAVEQDARFRRARRVQAAEMIVPADRDDRRLGEAQLIRNRPGHGPESGAARRQTREKRRRKAQLIENLLGPAPLMRVKRERARGERQIGGRNARQAKGDPVGDVEHAARFGESLWPMFAHPPQFAEAESRIDPVAGQSEQSFAADLRLNDAAGVFRAAIEPNQGRRRGAALSVDEDAGFADARDREAGDWNAARQSGDGLGETVFDRREKLVRMIVGAFIAASVTYGRTACRDKTSAATIEGYDPFCLNDKVNTE